MAMEVKIRIEASGIWALNKCARRLNGEASHPRESPGSRPCMGPLSESHHPHKNLNTDQKSRYR